VLGQLCLPRHDVGDRHGEQQGDEDVVDAVVEGGVVDRLRQDGERNQRRGVAAHAGAAPEVERHDQAEQRKRQSSERPELEMLAAEQDVVDVVADHQRRGGAFERVERRAVEIGDPPCGGLADRLGGCGHLGSVVLLVVIAHSL
jgi:hypothetical protein